MDDLINISQLNDFIFCPVSIYFHNLYQDTSELLYASEKQLKGKAAHVNVDNKKYSNRKNVLSGLSVYSEKYGLIGKIDIYDGVKNLLIEPEIHIMVTQ